MQGVRLAAALLLTVSCSSTALDRGRDAGFDSSAGDVSADVSPETGDDGGTIDQSDDVVVDASPETGDDAVVDASPETGGDAGALGHGLLFDISGWTGYLQFERCDSNGACSANKVCFHVTADIALCDAAQPAVATTCSTNTMGVPPDACGCNGLVCAANQDCINIGSQLSGGNQGRYNVCVDAPCTGPADCAAGTSCTPTTFIMPEQGRCLQPLCAGDAECVDGSDGRCALIIKSPIQSGPSQHIVAVRCVYRGTFDDAAPDPSLCAGTRPVMAALRDPTPVALGGFYYCPSLTR